MPKPYPDKAVSQIRIDKQLFETIKAIAQHENRSMNAQIEFFLRIAVVKYQSAARQSSNPAQQ